MTRTLDDLRVAFAGEFPESAEALVAFVENHVALAERRGRRSREAQGPGRPPGRGDGGMGALQFALEQQGVQSEIAGRKAREEMQLPESDLWALDGQTRMPTYG